MQRRLAFLISSALIGMAACSFETALHLTIDTDLRVPEELDGLRIIIETDAKLLLDRTYPIASQDDIPATLKVVNETEKEVSVLITVLGLKGTSEVASGTARADFVLRETVEVAIFVTRTRENEGDAGRMDAGSRPDASRDSGAGDGKDAELGDADAADSFYADTDASMDDTVDAGLDSGFEDAGSDSGRDAGIDPADVMQTDAQGDAGTVDVEADALVDASFADEGVLEDASTNDVADDAGILDVGGPEMVEDAGCLPICAGRCGGPDSCFGVCPDDCVLPDTCGGGGTQYQCGCSPTSQPDACTNKCGSVSNGCGGTHQCGDCSNGFECAGNTCICVSAKLCFGSCCQRASDVCHNNACCTPDCTGKCGGASDGCGGTCATCAQDFVCAGTACLHCGDTDEPCCPGDFCNGARACKSGSCAPESCAGRAELATCETVTVPDRAYDVCVGGACVSPGCADAACNAGGPHFPLPDTGQRSCFNNSTAVACPTGSGTPCSADGSPQFCGQDAQYGWDPAHQQNERFLVNPTVPSQPVAADNVTGLEWQGCAAGQTGGECTDGSTLSKTWADAVAYCDGLTWASSDDWRLPDRYELHTIVDMLYWNPSINVMAFPTSPSSSFWTMSSVSNDPTKAWAVLFDDGTVGNANKGALANVRCVRGGGPRAARFQTTEPKTGQPLVADSVTNVVWQGCAAGLTGTTCATGGPFFKNWADGFAYCESLDWGNLSDWRLPNANELSSIVDDRSANPAVDAIAFPAAPGNWTWTATSVSADPTWAWSVNFADGYVTWLKKTGTAYVRCVRGGQ